MKADKIGYYIDGEVAYSVNWSSYASSSSYNIYRGPKRQQFVKVTGEAAQYYSYISGYGHGYFNDLATSDTLTSLYCDDYCFKTINGLYIGCPDSTITYQLSSNELFISTNAYDSAGIMFRAQGSSNAISINYSLGYDPDYESNGWSYTHNGYDYNPSNLKNHKWSFSVDEDVTINMIAIKL